MECEAKNSSLIELFWDCFNEVLLKETGDDDYIFNPRGWITDMAGANMEGLKRSIGEHALQGVKTCEFHFKECRNRQARKLNEEERRNFKVLCDALLEVESPIGYERLEKTLTILYPKCQSENISKHGKNGGTRDDAILSGHFFRIPREPPK